MKAAINFRDEPLGRLMLKLSIPAFLAIVMNLLYGFIDGIFIGKGINSLALGGVTIVFPLTIIVISFASMAGEGLASITARGIAGGKEREVMETIKAGPKATTKIKNETKSSIRVWPFSCEYLIVSFWLLIFYGQELPLTVSTRPDV